MALELGSIKKAVASMERVCEYANKKIAADNVGSQEMEVIKAAAIQNFEFTYELCWKFMKRWLEANYSETLVSGCTRKQLFRYAAENLLINEVDAWLHYHELRNKTSHTYDSEVAKEIFEATGFFLIDAKTFMLALEVRND